MSRRTTRLLGVALVALATVACDASVSTANLRNVALARDEDGRDTTSTFSPDDTFFVVGELRNAPDDTVLRAEWIAVEVEGEDADTPLDDAEVTSAGGDFEFNLTNDDPWPEGQYKVELYLDDELEESLDFEVVSEAADGGRDDGEGAGDDPPDDGDAVTSRQDVERATIRVVAQGSFVDPEVGMRLNEAGSGSGFIIDPEGIAVTNNHVVTGAAIVKVYVGDDEEARNARILGVSECSDLAVIDIEGEGFPYLQWYDGRIEAGLDVFAVGFPLGDPQFTMTRGIVAKERANGESNWASVDNVIQHDATINPGNSGGPLITEDGAVVGVNYAGDTDTNQYFAIRQEEALEIIDRLREGEDVTSIGINGTAVNDGESLSGIWVSSVKSGSPADMAGIRGGDIVTKLEGLVLSTDGTMADYCDVLRGHDPEDTLRVEVLRFDTEEVLEGQLNGRELEQSFSFAQAVDESDTGAQESAGVDDYPEYVSIQDDSGAIAMKVPAAWSDVDGTAWTKDGENRGASITASGDRTAFLETYDEPGVFFGASRTLATQYDPAGLLDFLEPDMGVGQCDKQGREDYEDPFYTGVFDTYANCGGEDAGIITVAAVPEDASFILFLLIQIVGDRDLQALDQIIDTFQVVGDLE
jgi:serine protease Do